MIAGMIQCPAGWHTWRAGDCLMAAPDDPSDRAILTYQERLTPVRSIKVTAREIIATDPAFQLKEEYRIKRFLTMEGEYGAYMSVSGVREDKPTVYCFASVMTEYFNTKLVVRGELAQLDPIAALVMDLAQRDRLGLGLRRRRIGFTPPKDWHPIPGLGLDMVLLPPDYPHTHASITVYPAVPVELAIHPLLFQREHDARIGLPAMLDSYGAARTRSTKRNTSLHGREWTSRRPLPNGQGEFVRYLVVLRDRFYFYSTKLEALAGPRLDNLHQVFVDMMGTIEAVPQPTTEVRPSSIWDD
jgi:hypothetical protein